MSRTNRTWQATARRGLLGALLSLVALSLGTGAPGHEPDPDSARPLSPAQAFDHLKTNAPVEWLVRMVAYDPADPKLEVHHLTSLGGPHEDFTFVADYAELRGYRVADAVHKSGGSLQPGQRVACILFPIGRHTIYPASVRGVLQVVQQIDMRRSSEPGYRSAPLDTLLTDRERASLSALAMESWAWDNYRQFFPAFAQAVATLRTSEASAFARIGHIGHDWCEAGCARWLSPGSAANENSFALELPDNRPFTIKNFGVRVFLIRNLPLDTIEDRVLLDITDPQTQPLPDLPAAK